MTTEKNMKNLVRLLPVISLMSLLRPVAAQEAATQHVVKGAQALRLISALQDAGVALRPDKRNKAYVQQAKGISCLVRDNVVLDWDKDPQCGIPRYTCQLDNKVVNDDAKAKAIVEVMDKLKIVGQASMGGKSQYDATNLSCRIDMTIEFSAEMDKRFVCTLSYEENSGS
jgi:hypothetical protein